jgi:hypothetical protein
MSQDLSPADRLERYYARLLLKTGVTIEEINELLDYADVMESHLQDTPGRLTIPREAIPYIKKVRKRPYLAFGTLGILRLSAKAIIERYKVAGIDLGGVIYVGEYPTHDFNACVIPHSDGALILINSGLPIFLDNVARVAGASVIADSSEPGQSTYSSAVVSGFLTNQLISYLALGLHRSSRLLPLTFTQWVYSSFAGEQALNFVVAHELAHVALSHERPSLEAELAADGLAVGALRLAIASSPANPNLPSDLVEGSCGPLLFLAIDDLVAGCLQIEPIRKVAAFSRLVFSAPLTALPNARQEWRSKTHPSATTRSLAIRSLPRGPVGRGGYTLDESYAGFIGQHRDEIIEGVGKWCSRVAEENQLP